MRFGGHETFPVRTGWLSKGLRLLQQDGGRSFDRPDVADELGVGRNMAKSIRHWLYVTGLALRAKRNEPLNPSELGELVLDRDPYFQHMATWWALHVNVATQPEAAVAWRWFFNDFTRERFDRMACSDEFVRALERIGGRLPSHRTVARDIACLLQSYSTPIPREQEDPENATDCPFRQLGLLVHHRDTGYIERRFGERSVPPDLLGYVLARMLGEDQRDVIEIPFADALVARRGPGRIFALDADGLAALVDAAEHTFGKKVAGSYLLGGERMITIVWRSPISWLVDYYDRVVA